MNVIIMSSNNNNEDLWKSKLRNRKAYLVEIEFKLLNSWFHSAHSNYSCCQQDENLLPQEVVKGLMHSYTTQHELHPNERVLSNILFYPVLYCVTAYILPHTAWGFCTLQSDEVVHWHSLWLIQAWKCFLSVLIKSL